METYEYVKNLYYNSIFNLTAIEENIHLFIYSFAAFFVPFMLGHPQILVGCIVNCALILGATYLKGHKLVPVIILPSIGVLTAGIIFGTFTPFLVIMVPFIWIGNAAYAYGYKALHSKTKSYLLSVFVSSLAKAGLLFGAAFALVSMNLLPAMFLTAMGWLQLTTALIGGAAAIGVIKAREHFVK
jgi:hypothetical protein